MRRQSCLHILLQILILAALPLGASQAESDHYWSTNRYEWSAQTATADGRVRVTITKRRPKLYLTRHQRPVILSKLSDDESDYYDELPDIQVGYRRPELVNQTAEIYDDISDEIKIRLVLARKRALQAYHANWG
jgi:hypothetical protein